MNDKFDELAKGLAQSVTRRAALKKFAGGVAGVVLATLGLANKAEAVALYCPDCHHPSEGCARVYGRNSTNYRTCLGRCQLLIAQGGCH